MMVFLASAYSLVPSFNEVKLSNKIFALPNSEPADVANALFNSLSCAFVNPNPSPNPINFRTMSGILSPHIVKAVIPNTNPVCQLKTELEICFHKGMAVSFLAINAAFSARTLAMLSANIGRLFEMAIMKSCGLMATLGNSRATC